MKNLLIKRVWFFESVAQILSEMEGENFTVHQNTEIKNYSDNDDFCEDWGSDSYNNLNITSPSGKTILSYHSHTSFVRGTNSCTDTKESNLDYTISFVDTVAKYVKPLYLDYPYLEEFIEKIETCLKQHYERNLNNKEQTEFNESFDIKDIIITYLREKLANTNL